MRKFNRFSIHLALNIVFSIVILLFNHFIAFVVYAGFEQEDFYEKASLS